MRPKVVNLCEISLEANCIDKLCNEMELQSEVSFSKSCKKEQQEIQMEDEIT